MFRGSIELIELINSGLIRLEESPNSLQLLFQSSNELRNYRIKFKYYLGL